MALTEPAAAVRQLWPLLFVQDIAGNVKKPTILLKERNPIGYRL